MKQCLSVSTLDKSASVACLLGTVRSPRRSLMVGTTHHTHRPPPIIIQHYTIIIVTTCVVVVLCVYQHRSKQTSETFYVDSFCVSIHKNRNKMNAILKLLAFVGLAVSTGV